MNTATHTATVQIWDASRQYVTVPAKVTEEPRHYSATGYGRKLPTRYMVHYRGRWRRVYCCQISNSGTCYVGKPGKWEVVVDDVTAATN